MWETNVLITYYSWTSLLNIHIIFIEQRMGHWGVRFLLSNITGLLIEKKVIIKCLFLFLTLVLENLLHWFHLSNLIKLLIHWDDIVGKKKIFNRFLGTLTIETNLYLVDYINHMASTNFPRANKNRDFEKKKKQK